jgi:UDP-N-acetylglucosamine:LPS N-acetylglucosamine transferase
MNSQEIDEILQHLENAKYIGASKAVQIIHQLNKECSRLSQRVLDLEDKLGKGVLGELLRENEQLKRLGVPDEARQKLHKMEIEK